MTVTYSENDLRKWAATQVRNDISSGRRAPSLKDDGLQELYQLDDETWSRLLGFVDVEWRKQLGIDAPSAPRTPMLAEVDARATTSRRGPYRRRLDRASMGHWITASQDRLLRALIHCFDAGRSDPSIEELAARVGCHPRTVQLGLSRLKSLELILVTARPTKDGRNRTNVFTILPEAFARLHRRESSDSWVKNFAHPSDIRKKDSVTGPIRSAPRRPADRGPGAPATLTSSPNTPGMAGTTEERQGRQKSLRQDGGRVFHRGSRTGSSAARPTAPQPAADDRPAANSEFLASRAAAALLPPGKAVNAADPWTEIERERAIRLSRFHNGAWQRAIAVHGRESCLLAAAVAMLKPISAAGDEIKSRAAYLGGMLRSASLDPASSLRLILGAGSRPRPQK